MLFHETSLPVVAAQLRFLESSKTIVKHSVFETCFMLTLTKIPESDTPIVDPLLDFFWSRSCSPLWGSKNNDPSQQKHSFLIFTFSVFLVSLCMFFSDVSANSSDFGCSLAFLLLFLMTSGKHFFRPLSVETAFFWYSIVFIFLFKTQNRRPLSHLRLFLLSHKSSRNRVLLRRHSVCGVLFSLLSKHWFSIENRILVAGAKLVSFKIL